jgi:putative tricarboxylic transport membrane protein
MAGVNFVGVVIGLLPSASCSSSSSRCGISDPGWHWLPTTDAGVYGDHGARCGHRFRAGLLPGSAGRHHIRHTTSSASPDPSKFGRGAYGRRRRDANNATCSGGFVPLFAFGVPSSPPLAVLLERS